MSIPTRTCSGHDGHCQTLNPEGDRIVNREVRRGVQLCKGHETVAPIHKPRFGRWSGLVPRIELQGLLLRIDLPTIDPEWNREAEMDGCLLSRMRKCCRQPA